jgi:hypothetical protein
MGGERASTLPLLAVAVGAAVLQLGTGWIEPYGLFHDEAYYGRERGLPPVVAPHNAYWFWREEAAGRDLVVAVGVESEVLSRYFADTRLLRIFRCRYCDSFRPDLPVLLGAQPVRSLQELLEEWRHFGIDAAPALLR